MSATIDFGQGDVALEVPARPATNTSTYQKLQATWTFPAPVTWGRSPPINAKVRNCSKPVLIIGATVMSLGSATCGTPYVQASTGDIRVLEPPVGVSGPLKVYDIYGAEDEPTTTINASYTFPTGGHNGMGTLRIDWGDGTTETIDGRPGSEGPHLSYEYTDGYVLVRAPHVYADGGTYTVRTAASSSQCADNFFFCLDTQVFTGARATAFVTDDPRFRAAPITAVEGDEFHGRVGDVELTCADCTYSAQIDWGDGTKNAATITPVTSTFRTINGSHTWTGEGSYVVETTLTIERAGNTIFRGAKSSLARVDDAPLFATQGFEVAPPNGSSFTIGHMSDANPAAQTSDYIVQIAWGDGTTGSGTAVTDPSGGFLILGNHTYPSQNGAYAISYKVTSDRGASTTGTAYYSSGAA